MKASFLPPFLLLLGLLASCSKDDCPDLNPEISSITESAYPGDTIRIQGVDFSDATQVLLNDKPLVLTSTERNLLLAIVPEDAGSGPVTLSGEQAPEYPVMLEVLDPGWRRVSTFSSEYLQTMVFAPDAPQTGWLAGSKLFHTTDGGLNWQQLSSPYIEGNPFEQIQAVSATHLFMLTQDYRNYLLKSENSGRDWQAVPLPAGEGRPVAMHFISAQEGSILISDFSNNTPRHVFYHTSDGGENWTPVFERYAIDYEGWFSQETKQESWFISSYYQKAYKISPAGIDSLTLPPLVDEGSPVLFSATGEAWAAGLPEGFHSKTVGGTDEWVTADPCLLWSSENGGKQWQKAITPHEGLHFPELKAIARSGNVLWGINASLDIMRYSIDDQQAQLRSIDQPSFLHLHDVQALHLMDDGKALLLAGSTLFRYLPE